MSLACKFERKGICPEGIKSYGIYPDTVNSKRATCYLEVYKNYLPGRTCLGCFPSRTCDRCRADGDLACSRVVSRGGAQHWKQLPWLPVPPSGPQSATASLPLFPPVQACAPLQFELSKTGAVKSFENKSQ